MPGSYGQLAPPTGNPSVSVSNNAGQMAVQLTDFPLGTTFYFCHTGSPAEYPAGGSVPSRGSIVVTSPNQSWSSGLCAGSGNFWLGIQATNGQDYYSNQVVLGTPPPTYCDYLDAGNGTPIRAEKGSTFTDSLGNKWLVGDNCELTFVPPPEPKCIIAGFSPRSVTMGIKPITVKTSIKTTGCTVSAWVLSSEAGEVFTTRHSSPDEVFDPRQWSIRVAGYKHDVHAAAANQAGIYTERDFENVFTVKRQTVWQARSFNASPEPVRKGKPITIKGRLLAADWKPNVRWIGYGGTTRIQFKATRSASYKTVKTVRASRTGYVTTTVTASKSGYWRILHPGNTALSSSTVAADYVRVK
jgi:hypothetical protein